MERREDPGDEPFSLQDSILVEMSCFVKKFYLHVLSDDEKILLESVLQLEVDSRKLLFSL